MDIMDTNPIPFSWMGTDDADYHTVFEASSPEQRELAVWLDGFWIDVFDVRPKHFKEHGKRNFPVFVDPDDDDKFIARLVKGLV
jgi:hypothetical protein